MNFVRVVFCLFCLFCQQRDYETQQVRRLMRIEDLFRISVASRYIWCTAKFPFCPHNPNAILKFEIKQKQKQRERASAVGRFERSEHKCYVNAKNSVNKIKTGCR